MIAAVRGLAVTVGRMHTQLSDIGARMVTLETNSNKQSTGVRKDYDVNCTSINFELNVSLLYDQTILFPFHIYGKGSGMSTAGSSTGGTTTEGSSNQESKTRKRTTETLKKDINNLESKLTRFTAFSIHEIYQMGERDRSKFIKEYCTFCDAHHPTPS